jgi:stage V sporulation protein AB
MLINQIICGFMGLCWGFLVAAGVFALITSIGIVPRLAGKTHTGRYVKIYEISIALGGTLGNIFYLYNLNFHAGVIGAGIFGAFSGIFIGCLATALAETINTIAIFSRRVQLKYGLGFVILSLAMGKLCGSMWYFYNHWF